MEILTGLLLVCATMALTYPAEAAANETEEPFVQEAVPEAEPGEMMAEPASHEDDRVSMLMSSYCHSHGHYYNRRCFFYVPTPMTWAYAEKHCQTLGGNLASVHSFDEYDFIQSVIFRHTNTYPLIWLGGSDAQEEGVWLWIDGSPFNFFNWAPGQPDNLNNGQHCLTMNRGDEKRWDDAACAASLPFVCAKKILSS